MTAKQINRRDFCKLLVGGFAGAMPLIGCQKNRYGEKTSGITQPEVSVYRQKTKGDGRIKLGVMSDLHAHTGNAQFFAEQLKKEGVEAFLLTGDISHSFGDYEGAKNDLEEIMSVVGPVADTGKLVLVIPGNHEQQAAYSKGLEYLTSKFPNVIDMEKTPLAVLDDLTIIALGGNDDPKFTVPQGYLKSVEDFERIKELARTSIRAKPLLVATHIPKKYSTKRGLDVIGNGTHVGSETLRTIREMIGSGFAVSGHIHESFGVITPDEQPLRQGELSEKLDFNPGAVFDHLKRGLRPAAGILEFIGKKARASILNR